MNLFTSIIATAVIGTQLASVGCATRLSRLRGNEKCIPHCHDEVSREVVDVGGQVHAPCQLEIGANGLILRHALMSAGGSREPGQVQEMVFNPIAVRQLEELESTAKTFGKLKKLYDRAIQMESPQAREFIFKQFDLTEEQLNQPVAQQNEAARALIKKQEDATSDLIDKLKTSFELRNLENLREYSFRVGTFEQDLVLIENPEVAKEVVDKKVDIENRRKAQEQSKAKVMEELLDRRGSTSLRNLPLQSQLLVAVERRAARPPVTYYFPYDLAADGIASDIALRGGDVVNVVDVRASDLIPPEPMPNVGNSVAIQGYLEEPVIAENVTTIRNIRSFSKPTTNDPFSVWTLVRPSPTGQARVFVFPDRMIASNGPIADAPTQEGDIYTYTTLPQVPIVFESLVTRTMGPEQERCRRKIQEMRQQHKEKCRSRAECVRDTISETLNCIPMPL